MKPLVRNILASLLILLFCAGCLVIAGINREKQSQLTCTGLQVRIADDWRFISDDDVKGYLEKHYGPYLGQRLDSVRLYSIENILNRQSAVLRTEAWTDRAGILHIDIWQREPELRLQMGNNAFYVDNRGCIFPHKSGYSSPVPVIDGAIPFEIPASYKGEGPDREAREWIAGMLSLADYMDKSRIWKDNISQISVLASGDLVLFPREGQERFLFGSSDSVREKFERISDYYKFVKPGREESYRTVNVKYSGQVICRK